MSTADYLNEKFFSQRRGIMTCLCTKYKISEIHCQFEYIVIMVTRKGIENAGKR